jgi:tRNA1Val (adenine37-N6)-methyltransferase
MIPAPEHIKSLKRFGKQNDIFIFKQFRLRDNRSTMRVGTDAVLLGIAVDTSKAADILEVGTGSGVISLILAQRSVANIDAVEIDLDSAEQAGQNASESPWAGRIHVKHISLQEYAKTSTKKYDQVVSNPPYFSRSFKSGCSKRNISRHDDELSFEELIEAASKLLNPEGSLWVILPAREGRDFREKALISGFYLHHLLWIIPKEGKQANRSVMGFARQRPAEIRESAMTLRNRENAFLEEYMAFASDFYIDF